jgi:RNA polymerase sigma-70 factor (ECF subfamily)
LLDPAEPLAALYDEHGARLYRYAVLLLANREAAEDAVQEAFIRLAAALARRHPPEVSFGYLAVIVRNECYSALRRRKRRGEDPGPIVEPISPQASEEERLIVDAALKALPTEQREVVYLKVFEGLTFQEIADRCGISINTAASRYRYAAAALRRTLSGSGR